MYMTEEHYKDYVEFNKRVDKPLVPVTEPWPNIKPCPHPQHEPPGMMVIYETYIHICPGCGRRVILRPSVTFM